MKKYIFSLTLLFAASSYASNINVDRMVFIAKNLFDRELVKDVEYIQGNGFELGANRNAYRLYFNAIVQGRKQSIQVNCTEPTKKDDPNQRPAECKVVKMRPI